MCFGRGYDDCNSCDGTGHIECDAYRTLSEKKFKEKKLFANDILIERSGGSETQPVGRVGFVTDEMADKDYAFANFIQRRTDAEAETPVVWPPDAKS